MPSPIAHTTMSYVVYRLFRPTLPQTDKKRFGPVSRLWAATIGLSMLPDLDSVFGLVTGNFGRYHNNVSHSLIVGLGIAFFAGRLALLKQGSKFWPWFLITLVCYEMHVVMDYFTVGRGVMAFWPLSSERFLSPVTLFVGLHWSDGVYSARHLWTILTELLFVLPLIAALRLMPFFRRKYQS